METRNIHYKTLFVRMYRSGYNYNTLMIMVNVLCGALKTVEVQVLYWPHVGK